MLAVYPGRGGQPFQPAALAKAAAIRAAHPALPFLMLDGGIDDTTAADAAAAGANVLVSGSHVFSDRAGGLLAALPKLEHLLMEHCE